MWRCVFLCRFAALCHHPLHWFLLTSTNQKYIPLGLPCAFPHNTWSHFWNISMPWKIIAVLATPRHAAQIFATQLDNTTLPSMRHPFCEFHSYECHHHGHDLPPPNLLCSQPIRWNSRQRVAFIVCFLCVLLGDFCSVSRSKTNRKSHCEIEFAMLNVPLTGQSNPAWLMIDWPQESLENVRSHCACKHRCSRTAWHITQEKLTAFNTPCTADFILTNFLHIWCCWNQYKCAELSNQQTCLVLVLKSFASYKFPHRCFDVQFHQKFRLIKISCTFALKTNPCVRWICQLNFFCAGKKVEGYESTSLWSVSKLAK